MRKHYIDNIRWATVVTVMIYHVFYMYNGVASDGVAGPFRDVQYQDAVQYLLYPWFMALLFIVSGMCARYYLDRHTAKEFIRARTTKLLVPSTVGLLAFQWIQGLVNTTLSNASEQIGSVPKPIFVLILCASGIGVLWYIQMLWVFSVLLIPIRKIEKGKLSAICERTNIVVLVLLGVAVWGAAQVLNTPVITVYRFGIYGLCFLLGYFVFSHEAVTDRLAKFSPFLAVIAAVLGVLYTVFYFGENYAVEPAINCPLAIAFAWLACLAIIGLMKRFGNRQTKLTEFMTKKSWGLYVFHYLPVSACGLLFRNNTVLPPVLIYIITLLAAFAGGLLLYEIISRIPFFRWCVLGIKKEK